jgi:hypothetical protein
MTVFLTKDSPVPYYMAFPRFLMDMPINETSKLLYMVLLDRARMSIRKTGWTDGNGRVFIYFPIRDLAAALGKGEMTVKTALTALENADLIQRVRQGIGKPNRIYVKCPRDSFLSPRQTESYLPDRQKTVPVTDRKLSGSNNNIVKKNEKKQKNSFACYDCKEDESL